MIWEKKTAALKPSIMAGPPTPNVPPPQKWGPTKGLLTIGFP